MTAAVLLLCCCYYYWFELNLCLNMDQWARESLCFVVVCCLPKVFLCFFQTLQDSLVMCFDTVISDRHMTMIINNLNKDH